MCPRRFVRLCCDALIEDAAKRVAAFMFANVPTREDIVGLYEAAGEIAGLTGAGGE